MRLTSEWRPSMASEADYEDLREQWAEESRNTPRYLSERECTARAADDIWGRDTREPIPYWPVAPVCQPISKGR